MRHVSYKRATLGGVLIMANPTGRRTTPTEETEVERIAKLLGGQQILRQRVTSPLDAHALIQQGFPTRALLHLFKGLVILRGATSLEKAVGISTRTIQRRKDDLSKLLSREQSGRTWKFAEILAKATEVFGSQEEAEKWLERPAMGLDQRRPIDLLATPAGVELVEDHLTRLEYGVYT